MANIYLGAPTGIFNLHDSDNCVGSFITKSDVAEIFDIQEASLDNIRFKNIEGHEVIDEADLQKLWYNNLIPNAPCEVKTSLDEILLRTIIKLTYPEILIEPHERVGRYVMDIKLTLNDHSLFIEFDGPSHFANSRYGIPKYPPSRKKQIIEDRTAIEVINWPYWIQRCQTNVRTLFEPNVMGLGALWSTNVHFGDFVFQNSADVIDSITRRFQAVDENGYGYFYIANTRNRNNPQHPIIDKILNGEVNINKLLPNGVERNKDYWLPEILRINI